MTQRLYLDDAYLKSCTARVLRSSLVPAEGAEVKPAAVRVVLDRTVLYAESGGQAPDFGTMRWSRTPDDPRAEAKVIDSQVESGGHVGDIVHTLAPGSPIPSAGATVEVEVDWPRRYGLMRHHTAAHVIAAILHNEFKASFTGGQLYPDRARIDVEFAEWKPEMKDELARRANEEIAKDYRVAHRVITRAEFEKGDLLRTKTDLIDPAVQDIRLTDIVGLDVQADGGTHVHSTREVSRVVIGKTDNKGKGHRRIEYRCE
ncbi:MAG: alanyl-tRNA editing protein [Thermoplasmatota archaeon]